MSRGRKCMCPDGIWFCSCSHLFFLFSYFSANVNRKTFKTSVKPGWYYFGRKMVGKHSKLIKVFLINIKNFFSNFHFPLIGLQDTADFEWMMWFSTFREHILFALSGHVLFAKIGSMLAPQVLLLTGSLIKCLKCCRKRSGVKGCDERPRV